MINTVWQNALVAFDVKLGVKTQHTRETSMSI